MEKLTNWLKNRRIKSKLDVRELSLLSFVSTSQISRIENNISDITVNTLVGLGYGLDFGLNEVLNELKISPYFPRTKNKKQSSALIPKIEDAYAIWLLFRDEPQKAKGLMYDGYRQIEDAMQGMKTQTKCRNHSTQYGKRYRLTPICLYHCHTPLAWSSAILLIFIPGAEQLQIVTWEYAWLKNDLNWVYLSGTWQKRPKFPTALYLAWKVAI